MKIIGRLSSLSVQKVIWCLGELGRIEGKDYERIEAGLEFGVNNTAEYLKMNPTGKVPTLVDGDFVLWESNAIVRYLAASFGTGGLLPQDLKIRADSERWMDWSLGTFWPELRTAFVGLTRTPKERRNLPAIKAAFDEGTRQVKWLNEVLLKQPYCAGANFTVGDIAAGVAVHRWINIGKQTAILGVLPAYEGIASWHKGIIARPAFQASLA